MKPGVVGTALVVVLGAGGAGALVFKDQGSLEEATASASEGEKKLAQGDLKGARKAFVAAKSAAGAVSTLTLQSDAAAAAASRARAGLRTLTALENAETDPQGVIRVAGSQEGLPADAVDTLARARASLLLDAALALETHEAVGQSAKVYAEARRVAKESASPRLAEAALGERRLTVLTNLREAQAALAAEDHETAGRLVKAAKTALEHSESPFKDPERVKTLGARVARIQAQVQSHLALAAYSRTVDDLYQKVDSEDLGTLYPVVKNLTAPKLMGNHPLAKAHATRVAALERQQKRILTVAKAFQGMVLAHRSGGVTVFVEKTEVSNADFARFVAAGGYAKEDLWSPAARSRLPNFVDRTGKPAPKYWSNAKPPKGRESFPVRGVSYFEAEAYAKWRGGRLPTAKEWRGAAAKPGQRYPWGSSWRTGVANVRETTKKGATVAIGRFPGGAGPTGALDVIGNVRELVRLGQGKYAGMGGSYNDKPANATADSKRSISATIRASDTGFRCAKELKWDR